jgi:hypothetical protein
VLFAFCFGGAEKVDDVLGEVFDGVCVGPLVGAVECAWWEDGVGFAAAYVDAGEDAGAGWDVRSGGCVVVEVPAAGCPCGEGGGDAEFSCPRFDGFIIVEVDDDEAAGSGDDADAWTGGGVDVLTVPVVVSVASAYSPFA